MNEPTTIQRVRTGLGQALKDLQSEKQQVIIPATPANPPIPSGHFHPLPEVFIQVGGYTEFTLHWTRFRLQTPRACVIPAYTPHKERFAHCESKFHYIVGMFSHEAVSWHEARLDETGKLTTTPSVICRVREGSRLIQLMEETTIAANQTSKYATQQQKGATLLAFAALLDEMENAETSLQYEHPKVSFCKRLINDHLDRQELCVKFLARQTDCSPNYLSSLFHQQTGLRLTDFINARRLDQVRGLLTQTTMNISEIAQACGYSDPGYMTRVFVKQFGLAPRQYRSRTHAAGN
jgi:AraC-like DNA-binding protein